MKSIRVQRVAHQIQKEVSQIVLKDIHDPKLGLVTITQVEVTPDLRQARIFYSIYADPQDIESSKRVMERAKPFIRRLIGRRIRLRYTPEIVFQYDHTPERADKIFTLLDKVEQEKKRER